MQDISVEYDTDEEEEKWRVVSERLMPLPDDFDFLSTGKDRILCSDVLQDLLLQICYFRY